MHKPRRKPLRYGGKHVPQGGPVTPIAHVTSPPIEFAASTNTTAKLVYKEIVDSLKSSGILLSSYSKGVASITVGLLMIWAGGHTLLGILHTLNNHEWFHSSVSQNIKGVTDFIHWVEEHFTLAFFCLILLISNLKFTMLLLSHIRFEVKLLWSHAASRHAAKSIPGTPSLSDDQKYWRAINRARELSQWLEHAIVMAALIALNLLLVYEAALFWADTSSCGKSAKVVCDTSLKFSIGLFSGATLLILPCKMIRWRLI